ncbi:MAG: S8 family serine peptidase, partial [Myxococcota bacterium]
DHNSLVVAGYSNSSAAVDLVAPGGNLSTDIDGDGLPDGIIAETINPADPTDVGYWVMSGTSQAAAQVSGLAVEFIGKGMSALEAESSMKHKANRAQPQQGRGSGYVDMDGSVGSTRSHEAYHVAMLPFLAEGAPPIHRFDDDEWEDYWLQQVPVDPNLVRPSARVKVFDADGNPARNLLVSGTILGNGDGIEYCKTDDAGECFLNGAAVARYDAQGHSTKFAWSIEVQSIAPLGEESLRGRTYRPLAALTYNDTFQELVAALDDDATLSKAMLAWSFSTSDDPDLGRVAESFSLVDSGSGLKSIPLGVVMTPGQVDDLGEQTESTVGVANEQIRVTLLRLDGSGLKSIPLGVQGDPDPDEDPIDIAFVDGTGLKSIPLGFRPGDGEPAPLEEEPPAPIQGTALALRLNMGGWQVRGYGAAETIGSSTQLGISPALTPEAERVELNSDDAARIP